MKLAGGYADLTSTLPPLLASQNSVLQLHDIPALLLILAQVRGGASGGGNDGGGHDPIHNKRNSQPWLTQLAGQGRKICLF